MRLALHQLRFAATSVEKRCYASSRVALDALKDRDRESDMDDAPAASPPATPSSATQSARGEQARGAMRDYLQNIGKSSNSSSSATKAANGAAEPEGSVWAKLKKDAAGSVPAASRTRAPTRPFVRSGPPSSSSSSSSSPSSSSSSSSSFSGPQRTPRVGEPFRPMDRSPPGSQGVAGGGNQVLQRRPRQSGDMTGSSAPRGSMSENMRTAGGGGGGGANKKRKPGGKGRVGGEDGKMGRARDDEGGGGSSDIPEVYKIALFDHEMYFEKNARAGKTIDTSEMDGIDAFLADFYMESSLVKGENNEYRAVVESPVFRRAKIPMPRSMQALLQSMQPDIYAAPEGSLGYALGASAWDVVSKNTCYNDQDRDYIANGIARETEKLFAYAAKTSKARVGELDLIFQPEFRKGLLGIEDERRRRAQEDIKPVDNYAQAETDWKVEAVVDEDQL